MAVHRMHDAGKPVELLISMVSENDFSYMFHKPNIKFTAMQAQAMGIRHTFFATKGEKEKELGDLKDALRTNGVTELVTGAVASRYQGDRINNMCRSMGIPHHAPLWGIDPLLELGELAEKYDAIVTQVSAEGFDDRILGRRIDGGMIELLQKLHERYRINMLFEGGEAESFVLDAPLFRRRIMITKSHTEWHGPVGRFVIEEAELEDR